MADHHATHSFSKSWTDSIDGMAFEPCSGRPILNHKPSSRGRGLTGNLDKAYVIVSAEYGSSIKEKYSQTGKMRDFQRSQNSLVASPTQALQEHQLDMEQHDGRMRYAVDPATMMVCGWGATLVSARQEGMFAFAGQEDVQVEDDEQEGAQRKHDEQEGAQAEHDKQERKILPIDPELSG